MKDYDYTVIIYTFDILTKTLQTVTLLPLYDSSITLKSTSLSVLNNNIKLLHLFRTRKKCRMIIYYDIMIFFSLPRYSIFEGDGNSLNPNLSKQDLHRLTKTYYFILYDKINTGCSSIQG